MRHLIIIAALCMITINASAQSSESIFYLHIGDTICRLACVKSWDSIQKEVYAPAPGVYERTVIDPINVKAIRQLVKDTVIRRVSFILLDTVATAAAIPVHADTAVPMTVLEPFAARYSMPPFDSFDYAVLVTMNYDRFMDLVCNGASLTGKDGEKRISIDGINYKCKNIEGYVCRYADFLSRLPCLKNGGSALLDLRQWGEDYTVHYPNARFALITITR